MWEELYEKHYKELLRYAVAACKNLAEAEDAAQEVFLKALSIARNLKYPTFDITTANFDLIDLGDFRRPLGYEHPQYYYRPRKNIVNRPVSCGGWGQHFCGDHQETIPNLWKKLCDK